MDKLYGIIGYPLEHSFSKTYFTQKFAEEGILDCSYETFPIKTIDELKDVINKNHNLSGFNITIPHKQSILSYLDDKTKLPGGLTACNCVKIVAEKIIGYNTDVVGFEQSLLPQLKNYHSNALILGNGGAAEAVNLYLIN